MDSNRDRQKYSQYGEGEFGIDWGTGLLVLLLALIAAAALIGSVGG